MLQRMTHRPMSVSLRPQNEQLSMKDETKGGKPGGAKYFLREKHEVFFQQKLQTKIFFKKTMKCTNVFLFGNQRTLRIQRRDFFFLTGTSTTHRFSAFCRTSPVSEHSKLGDFCRGITHGNVPNLWHHDSFLHIFLSSTRCKITTVSPSVLIHHSHTSSFRVNHSVF